MSPSDKRPNNSKSGRDYRQAALLATVPAILFAGPAVGFFIGKWLDSIWESEPLLTSIGAILGFVAAGVETYQLVKKASALNKDDEDESKD